MNDDKKLKAIDMITKNIDLNVDIHKAVEKGMEVRLKKQTIRFGIMAGFIATCAGILAVKFSLEEVFIGATIVFAALIPVSFSLSLRKLKGGSNDAD